jgi:hypothetical protein
MPCNASYTRFNFLESFSYELQFDMHFYMHSYLHKFFYSCKKWVLHSAWVVGCSSGCSGLLTSVVARRGSGDVCGWMVVWVVSRTWPPAAWDELSIRSSFPDLFLGGIIWVFSQTHKRWAPMLGLSSRGLTNSNVNGNVWERHARDIESSSDSMCPPLMRCSCGSIYSGMSNDSLEYLKCPQLPIPPIEYTVRG